MKKKALRILSGLLVSGCLLGGCQKSGDVPSSGAVQQTDAELPAIAAKWELVQYTVNGKTTQAKDLLPDVRPVAPGFTCDDGVNCVVSNGGKDHPGTITEQDGTYVIDFADTDQNMKGTIDGNTLTLVNTKRTVTFVFERK